QAVTSRRGELRLPDPRRDGMRLDFPPPPVLYDFAYESGRPLRTGRHWSDVDIDNKGVYGADSTLERHLRATPRRELAEGHHAALAGKGRGAGGLRPGDPRGVDLLQATRSHATVKAGQDPRSPPLREILPDQYLHPGRVPVPVLPTQVPDGGPHVRPCDSDRQGREKDLGEHRHGLLGVQQSEERANAGGSGYAVNAQAAQAEVEPGGDDHHRSPEHARELAGLPLLERGTGLGHPRAVTIVCAERRGGRLWASSPFLLLDRVEDDLDVVGTHQGRVLGVLALDVAGLRRTGVAVLVQPR